MSGRFHVVRGVRAAAGGALPRILVDETDQTLGNVVGTDGVSLLRYDINPTVFGATDDYSLYGKDRGMGRPISSNRDVVSKITSEALFDDNPAFAFAPSTGEGGSDLTMNTPMPTASFTWFAVATIDAVLKATPRSARLMTEFKPASTQRWFLSLFSSGNLGFGPAGTAEAATIPAVSVPAANTPFVVCGTYDYSGNVAKIYLNNSTVVDEGTPSVAQLADPDTSIGFGGVTGYTSTDFGWHGKVARFVMYDGALAASSIATVMTALKSKYGVA